MKYRIVSPRVGTPGEIWEPPVFVNVGILLANGFIELAENDQTPDKAKPTRSKVSKDKE